MAEQKPKYNLLLDQLKFIEAKALDRLNDENQDGDAQVFVDVLPRLAMVSLELTVDDCGPGFHLDENGNCVSD